MAQEIKKPVSQTNAPERHHEPFGLEPFGSMRTDFERLFDTLLGNRVGRSPLMQHAQLDMPIAPHIDVRENNGAYIIEAELPGMAEDDVSVTFSDGVLTLKGEKKVEHKEEKDDYHLMERSFGRFQRSFRMGDLVDVDAVNAEYANGVLTVTLPKKAEAETRERRVPISKR